MAANVKTRSIRKTVPARELPATWPEREQFAPDDLVTVWIELEDAELERATSLRQVMDNHRRARKGTRPDPGKAGCHSE